jgi:aspartate-semialdehyde dehydrogenase
MTEKRCAVVGATGIAGQQFLVALDGHPWFEVVRLAASERSAGKTYAAAIRDEKSGARRTKMGAAKGAVLTAEYLLTKGLMG